MKAKEVIEILEIIIYIVVVPSLIVYYVSHNTVYVAITVTLTLNLARKTYSTKKKIEKMMKKVEKALEFFS
ncbi:hypothetical protein D1T48_gp11 [Thermoproteus tenax virus 1]|uniref:Uncharacterized 8.1 kDa protein n=1 Tax=Thermoproteus tenax virus 1 (strain KRA1) TaxID=10480 RepID=YORA_TTV1K|nr:hypothetical protein D1T48_gp11 [Thermoproteus tenax virus 1]P19285.1 RecName: Full=Uncharacterized 8.1 kDa protein [Thermoproteus tenax virus 1 (STRAIN KRA1)]CAA32979.1 unnamed protein product [Thermoproteus tenax virus 1]